MAETRQQLLGGCHFNVYAHTHTSRASLGSTSIKVYQRRYKRNSRQGRHYAFGPNGGNGPSALGFDRSRHTHFQGGTDGYFIRYFIEICFFSLFLYLITLYKTPAIIRWHSIRVAVTHERNPKENSELLLLLLTLTHLAGSQSRQRQHPGFVHFFFSFFHWSTAWESNYIFFSFFQFDQCDINRFFYFFTTDK